MSEEMVERVALAIREAVRSARYIPDEHDHGKADFVEYGIARAAIEAMGVRTTGEPLANLEGTSGTNPAALEGGK